MSDTGEFRPDDPETVVVHYDLAMWDIDQRSALTEALATAGVQHVWNGDELQVPDEAEELTDEIFERLEAEIGPFPEPLDPDDEGTEFQLEEWSDAERASLASALVDAQIPHRWNGVSVIVAADAETVVDELLDAIEAGDVANLDLDADAAPDGILSVVFSIADRLARDVNASGARMELFDLVPQLREAGAPFGITSRVWETVLGHAQHLCDAFMAEEFDPGDVTTAAGDLRDVCRPWV